MREVRHDHYPQCTKGNLLSSTLEGKIKGPKEGRFGLHQKGPQKDLLCKGDTKEVRPAGEALYPAILVLSFYS